MDVRKNVEALIKSGVNANRTARETGLSVKTVYRIFTGETALEVVAFGKLEKLAAYYEKIVKDGVLNDRTQIIEMTQKATRRTIYIGVKSASLDLKHKHSELRLQRLSLLQQSVYNMLDEVLDMAVEAC